MISMSSSSFFGFVLLFAIVMNTMAAPVIRQRRQYNFGQQGTGAFERAWNAAQTGKANTGYGNGYGRFRSFDDFDAGGQVNGGIPLIYNGPQKSSIGLGAAVSSGLGADKGTYYAKDPDFGVGLAFRQPLNSNGAYLGLGAGTSFGSSYSKPILGAGFSIKIPLNRRKNK
ncbi:unnamed protein product [Rotaria magnacalcarata]|uniref:Uncharacterized protein n=1 Tax=Rotaria magnacalcarata TaxID=392030 RepID=A0A816T0J2_9BILA|nr:unnamed protein product [Rotaria magnacalcarata]CAF4338030.1 unnamed protein product [Rotaria magnacalcarata]